MNKILHQNFITDNYRPGYVTTIKLLLRRTLVLQCLFQHVSTVVAAIAIIVVCVYNYTYDEKYIPFCKFYTRNVSFRRSAGVPALRAQAIVKRLIIISRRNASYILIKFRTQLVKRAL